MCWCRALILLKVDVDNGKVENIVPTQMVQGFAIKRYFNTNQMISSKLKERFEPFRQDDFLNI